MAIFGLNLAPFFLRPTKKKVVSDLFLVVYVFMNWIFKATIVCKKLDRWIQDNYCGFCLWEYEGVISNLW